MLRVNFSRMGVNRADPVRFSAPKNGVEKISGEIFIKTEEQFKTLVDALKTVSQSQGFVIELKGNYPEPIIHRHPVQGPTNVGNTKGFIKFSSSHPITLKQERAFAAVIAKAGFNIDNHTYIGGDNGPFSYPHQYKISSPAPKSDMLKKYPGYCIREEPNYVPDVERVIQANTNLSLEKKDTKRSNPRCAYS